MQTTSSISGAATQTHTSVCGQNQRAFFANELMKTDWSSLYAMDSCDEQFSHFQSTINSLLDSHMPLRKSKRCPTDGPWITTHCRHLLVIQGKLLGQEMELYKQLRNKVNCLNRKLKANYYKNVVEKLQNIWQEAMPKRDQGTDRKQWTKWTHK